MEEIKATDVANLLRGRMGLIIGPGVTKCPGSFTELSAELAAKGEVSEGRHYIETGDASLDKSVTEDTIKQWIRECISGQSRAVGMSQLAKIRWGAVLSASLDLEFEDRFEQEKSRHPTWPPVTTLVDLQRSPPPGTLPVYKLLGLASRDDFVFSEAGYIRQKATWRHAVKGFADLVKGNPILCLGLADCPWLLFDLIGEMLAAPSTLPSSLLLLHDDPLCNNPRLAQLLKQKGKLAKVRGTVGDVAGVVAAEAKQGYGQRLPFPVLSDDAYHELRPFHDMVTVVNDHFTAAIQATERNRLLDLLFAPWVACWDPFAHDMDFPRTVTAAVAGHLLTGFNGKHVNEEAAAVVGSAASGKSMILKRAAFDVARNGVLVLWLKPWFHHEVGHALGKIFHAVGKITEKSGRCALVVMDDPAAFGSMSPRDVVSAARSSSVTVQILVAVRASEWGTIEQAELVGGLPVTSKLVIPDELDADEWLRLPAYLLKLGVATDLAAAKMKVDEAKSKATADTLSTLYWLLPETKGKIASSIRDEYNRLGDMAGLKSLVLGSMKHSTDLLRRAYAMVAVADHYQAALPIEVLVSALEVDYAAWRDATRADSGAWGLFYDDDEEEKDTICYHVRNAVVTRFVVESVNGGSFGHSGEVKVLNGLLAACTGRSSPVYREFCVRVLVPYKKIEQLEYEDGLRLYDTAITALPHQDRTLEHHKGLWIKNVGNDPVVAKAVLKGAVNAKVYPHTNRPEVEEHIYTSLAATTLDEIDQQKCGLEDGKREVMEYLARARASGFFSAKAVHVQANMILRLAEKEESTASADYVALINKAMADIDHTLLMLASQAKESRGHANDILMLEEIRTSVLAKTLPLDALKTAAQRLFDDHKNQEGFVLVGRKMFADALARDRKYNIAFEKCESYMRAVKDAGEVVLPALSEVALHVYYHWRVRRSLRQSTNYGTDWDKVRDLSRAAMQSVASAKNPLLRHIHALALAHLGRWQDANTIYAQLRQEDMPNTIKYAARDYLLTEQGRARQVQGEMKRGADREYLYIEQLGFDLLVDKRGHWPRLGEITHAYVRFSFAGPLAVNEVE